MAGMFLLAAPRAGAEQPADPKPQPPQPPAGMNPIPQVSNWNPYLSDFENGDAERQKAAEKIFMDSGSIGYELLARFTKNPNADVVKRAVAARQQIEMRSMQVYQQLAQVRAQADEGPLTTAKLQDLTKSLMAMANYIAPQNLKRSAYQLVSEVQKLQQEVADASKRLEVQDGLLKGPPEANGILRASIQLERVAALRVLHRDDEAFSAAKDAVQASGEGRHTPAALRALAEGYIHNDDHKNIELVCAQILRERPRSLEVKFAHRALIDSFLARKMWDEAMKQAQAFAAAFPVDDDSQQAVYAVLGTLMDTAHDYKRVAAFAEWAQAAFPLERVAPEVPKNLAGTNEYVLKDFSKALKAYEDLRDKYADVSSPEELSSAVARVRAKAEGKFPKEPLAADPGPAGALARFLKAIRDLDTKAAADAVIAKSAEEYGAVNDDLVPAITFADFIVKSLDVDEKAGTAKINIDYYETASDKPKPIVQTAVMEKGKWKIDWQDLDAGDGTIKLDAIEPGK